MSLWNRKQTRNDVASDTDNSDEEFPSSTCLRPSIRNNPLPPRNSFLGTTFDDDNDTNDVSPARSGPGVVVLKQQQSAPSENPKARLKKFLQSIPIDHVLRIVDVDLDLKIEMRKIKIDKIGCPYLALGCQNLPGAADLVAHPEWKQKLVHLGLHRYAFTYEKVTIQIHLHATVMSIESY